jgi:hypothetical protein
VGQTLTGARGDFDFPDKAVTLTGQQATAQGGVLAPALDVILTGQSAPATTGGLLSEIGVVLVGQAATGQQGELTPNIGGDKTVALVGLQAQVRGGVISFPRAGALVVDLWVRLEVGELIAEYTVESFFVATPVEELTVRIVDEPLVVQAEIEELIA